MTQQLFGTVQSFSLVERCYLKVKFVFHLAARCVIPWLRNESEGQATNGSIATVAGESFNRLMNGRGSERTLCRFNDRCRVCCGESPTFHVSLVSSLIAQKPLGSRSAKSNRLFCSASEPRFDELRIQIARGSRAPGELFSYFIFESRSFHSPSRCGRHCFC